MLAFLGFSVHVRDSELASWMRLFVVPYCLANHSLAPLAGFGSSTAQAALFAPPSPSLNTEASWLTAAAAAAKVPHAVETPPSPPASPSRAEGDAPVSPKLVSWQHSVARAGELLFP